MPGFGELMRATSLRVVPTAILSRQTAGIRGGTTWGASDKNGEYPTEHPTSPEDLAATIVKALGIDPATVLPK